jgi:hypothetical protein
MADFAKTSTGGIERRWNVAGRVVLGVVVAGSVCGVVCSAVSAMNWQLSSEYNAEAAAHFAQNNSAQAIDSVDLGNQNARKAAIFTFAQAVCEAAVLQLILLAFLGAGVACARRISLYIFLLGGSDIAAAASSAGRQLRLRIVGTTAFTFVTFLLRSFFSTMYATAYGLQAQISDDKTCALKTLCDTECYNVYSHLIDWMAYNPVFQLTIVLISSPVSLLVALWGMTSSSTLRALQKNNARGELLLAVTK